MKQVAFWQRHPNLIGMLVVFGILILVGVLVVIFGKPCLPCSWEKLFGGE